MKILEQLECLQFTGRGDIVVYTAIIDGYDELCNPPMVDGIDYVCFTDDENFTSEKWHIVHVPFSYRDPRRLAKLFKLLPHMLFPNYRYSVWMDGSLKLKGNFDELLKSYCLDANMTVFPHPKRDCIYDEGVACLRLGKDTSTVIEQQLYRYRTAGYPRHNGLIAGTILVRKHNEKSVRRLMEAWWQEVDIYSVRDQLSFNYVAWSNGFEYSVLPFRLDDNKYFLWDGHRKFVFYDHRGKRKVSLRLFCSGVYNKICLSIKSYRGRNTHDK